MTLLQKSIWIIAILISFQTLAFGQKSFTLKGQILDGELDESLIGASVFIKNSSPTVGSATNVDGKFSFEIDEKYWNDTILISMVGYSEQKIAVSKAKDLPKQYLEAKLGQQAFLLNQAVIEGTIILNNISFDFNKHELLPTSFPELEKVYNMLKKKEKINIEIAGHTDSVGTEVYNAALSEARASAVMAYLEEKGIDQNRMVAKGYGEIRPIVSNKTEKGQMMNRRVEVTVLSSEGKVINQSQMPDTTRLVVPDIEITEDDEDGVIVLIPPVDSIKAETVEIPIPVIDDELTDKGRAIQTIANDYAVNKGFNGVISIRQNGENLYKNGVGFSNIGLTKPNTLNTQFHLGTISEQFTAALILKLVKSKKVDLGLSIGTYLDGLPTIVSEKITILQLLSHTSGLCDVNDISEVDLCFLPDKSQNYSAINYILLGKILEKIHQSDYKTIVEKEIIKALELEETSIASATNETQKVAQGYRKDGKTLDIVVSEYNEHTIAANGIISTVSDLEKFQRALNSNTWFSADLKLLMQTASIENKTFSGELTQVVMGTKVLKVLISKSVVNGHQVMVIKTPSSNSIVTIASNVESANLQPLYRDILKALFL